MLPELAKILNSRLSEDGYWRQIDSSAVTKDEMAQLTMGPQQDLVWNDTFGIWARWFLWGLVDLRVFVTSEGARAGQVYSALRTRLAALLPEENCEDRDRLARSLAHCAVVEIHHLAVREQINQAMRLKVLREAGSDARCWICGYLFSEWARAKIYEVDRGSAPVLPVLVDYWMPRGIYVRDIEIEVDHMIPRARGGTNTEDNLRLCCGWCNSHKADNVEIWDGGVTNRNGFWDHTHKVWRTQPQPHWIVRTLALRGRCAVKNCQANSSNSQIFAVPLVEGGAPTPANITVRCAKHDKDRARRLKPRSWLLNKEEMASPSLT